MFDLHFAFEKTQRKEGVRGTQRSAGNVKRPC